MKGPSHADCVAIGRQGKQKLEFFSGVDGPVLEGILQTLISAYGLKWFNIMDKHDPSNWGRNFDIERIRVIHLL